MTDGVADIPPVADSAPGTEPTEETNRFDDFLGNLEDTPEELKDIPPRRGRAAKVKMTKEARPRKPLPRWKDGAISTFAERIYKTAGAALLINHDPEIRLIGQQLIDCAYQCAEAWEAVAKRNEMVRRVFDRLMSTSELGELFWAHVPIFVPVLRKFGPLRSAFGNIQEQFEEEFERAA